MSEFLEEVFAAQSPADEPPPHLKRQADEGLSGSARRYVMLLVLLVSLTAVPTWIMLRAGADELNQQVAAPVRPILPPDPPQTTDVPLPVPSPAGTPAWVEPEPVRPAEQPPPREQAKPPVLERRSTVDTPPRPVNKKNHHSGVSTRPEPCARTDEDRCHRPGGASTEPEPVDPEPTRPIVVDPRRRIPQRPQVDRPWPPDIEWLRWPAPPCPYARYIARRAFS